MMEKSLKEKILIIILRLSGLLLITAFIAVLLPYDTMDRIHQQLGLGNLPQAPIVDYLARSVSFFYGMHGVIVLYISFNLRKYLSLLKLLCFLGFLFGITLFLIDINAPMPARWTFAEGPIVVTLNLVVYILVKMLERENQ
jgi:hypothetical protein